MNRRGWRWRARKGGIVAHFADFGARKKNPPKKLDSFALDFDVPSPSLIYWSRSTHGPDFCVAAGPNVSRLRQGRNLDRTDRVIMTYWGCQCRITDDDALRRLGSDWLQVAGAPGESVCQWFLVELPVNHDRITQQY